MTWAGMGNAFPKVSQKLFVLWLPDEWDFFLSFILMKEKKNVNEVY